MTIEEVMQFRGGYKPSSNPTLAHSKMNNKALNLFKQSKDEKSPFVLSEPTAEQVAAFPQNFDWRTARPGAVAPVKDQGICGSCWAFSLVNALESANYIKTGKMALMPEQFVIDCTWDETSSACDGGLSDDGAKQIIKKFGGLVPSAESYGEYLTVDGYCRHPNAQSEFGAETEYGMMSSSSNATSTSTFASKSLKP